jgi:TOMM system kinase/cyclase fusion protein
MKCPKCNYENPAEAKFCMQCGAKMSLICSQCGAELPLEAKFCLKCGTRVAPETPTEATVPDEPEEAAVEPSTEVERRQLTVMFCDMVGSTPLSEKLDPEELREILHDYQSGCAKVIRGFDGHIARYFGDGILVYFGYPVAHEDDAQRAVRAGLGVVEGIKQLNIRLQQERGMKLEVRLGIHTGVVVAGDMDQNEQLESMAIVGETPNLADRLQKLAEPNTLVISSVTHRLTEGFFDCRSLGSHSLAGISRPVEVYQVLHESGARTRLDTAELTGLTPLVGRERELSLLLERWEQAKEGIGHVVLLGGEAGIGKSRMVQVLKERIAAEPQAWLTECRCSPYHQNTILYPVVELFEQTILQFDRDDSPEEKLNKVEAFLVRYGLPLDETVPLFATFLSIPLGESYSPLSITPKQQKERTINTLIDILIRRASQQPVLFVVEDLHWADASSLELLDLLIDRGPVSRLFTLFTFRPAFTPPWTGRSHLTYMTLNRLTPKQVSDMVQHIAAKPLPAQVMGQIVDKTDGVPLFVEELTKMVLESGLLREQEERYELAGPLPPLAIPATLHDSLMARLDRLSAVKEVAQLGATLGREFPYELLQAVSPLNEDTLQRSLAQLVDAEMLYQRGLPPQATYLFKHSLIRDTAYESLLRSRRQQYHQQIATAIEKRFPEIVEIQPELVAHHYTAAGLSEPAIPYWLKAGQQAAKRSANVEAINHLSQGLELIKNLPETPERVQQELALQLSLGQALIASIGYGVPEVGTTFNRARELCLKLGETPQLFPALRGLAMFYFLRAEMQTARELGERILNIAQSSQDPSFLIEAHLVLGMILFHMGELVPSFEHLERGLALYEPQQHRELAFVYGRDPVVQCLDYMSWILFDLGYPDQALEKREEALKLAHQLAHPYSLVIALLWSAWSYHFRREASAVQEQAEAVIALCTEHNFPVWLGAGIILRGWSLAEQGEIEKGIAQMREGIAGWRAAGSETGVPKMHSILAEMLGKAGQIDEGLALLTEALATMERTNEHWGDAEAHRIKGELMLMQGADEAEVEACYHQAIEVARRQQARLRELRATVSLSRLWQKQGKTEEAGQMLQEIYDWFTEGFDTKDLKEAKSLLEELSSN